MLKLWIGIADKQGYRRDNGTDAKGNHETVEKVPKPYANLNCQDLNVSASPDQTPAGSAACCDGRKIQQDPKSPEFYFNFL